MRSSTPPHSCRLAVSGGRCFALAGLVLAALVSSARAQETNEGLFVTIPNPITSEVANRVRRETNHFADRFKGNEQRSLKIVLDFNPNDGPSSTGDFGACHDLAKHLQNIRLRGVNTIAFVHSEVTRHTVLPVLACEEIVMSERAALGNVVPDPNERLTPAERGAYAWVIEGRRPSHLALVLKMLDKDMVVLKARKLDGGSDWYIDAREVEAERKKGIVVPDPNAVAVREGQRNTLYDARQCREFQLCLDFFAESRQELLRKYRLPASSLRGDPLMGRTPEAWRVEVRGPVNRALKETLERRIPRAIGRGANTLILQLECAGGDTQVAYDLARWLRDRKDERGRPVLTIAYVPSRAADTAAILALGCTEIVLHKDAVFGDFENVVYEKRKNGQRVEVDPKRLAQEQLTPLMDLAEQQGYPPLLFRGMIDRRVWIFESQARSGEWGFVTREELEEDQQKPEKERKWKGGEKDSRLIKQGGENGVLFAVRATDQEKPDAKQLGIARYVVNDDRQLYSDYGLSADKVKVAGPDWLDDLLAFLQSSTVSIFLVMLGITCLILELKLPGVGLPGVVAAVCFVLFFWAHSQLAGQVTMLAVLLFVLALILLGIEIFVLPGFGVTGISGAVLLVASLALVTVGKWPQTASDWLDFSSSLATFALTAIGAVAAALILAWYLPNIPYVNRLILRPHEEQAEMALEAAPEAVQPDLAALLGAIGVAATPLRPAGKAQFGDEFVDVVAEGSYVMPGTRVQVIEIEGNRVVVKEV